jgi:hypothetical protein
VEAERAERVVQVVYEEGEELVLQRGHDDADGPRPGPAAGIGRGVLGRGPSHGVAELPGGLDHRGAGRLVDGRVPG